jgi:hypothetical protein
MEGDDLLAALPTERMNGIVPGLLRGKHWSAQRLPRRGGDRRGPCGPAQVVVTGPE